MVEAGTGGLRESIHLLRWTHGAATYAGFGVDAWDGYDDAATQLACVESGVVVGAIRITRGTGVSGEVFDDLVGRVPLPAEFVTFSRQLVAPVYRGLGIGVMLAHAASSWCSRNSSVEDVVVTAAQRSAPGFAGLGLRPITRPAVIGPGRMPAIFMAGKVSDVLEKCCRRLAPDGE